MFTSGTTRPAPYPPGTWLRELTGQRRHLLVHAARSLPGLAHAHVELLIEGSLGSRVSLSAAVLADTARYAVEAYGTASVATEEPTTPPSLITATPR